MTINSSPNQPMGLSVFGQTQGCPILGFYCFHRQFVKGFLSHLSLLFLDTHRSSHHNALTGQLCQSVTEQCYSYASSPSITFRQFNKLSVITSRNTECAQKPRIIIMHQNRVRSGLAFRVRWIRGRWLI